MAEERRNSLRPLGGFLGAQMDEEDSAGPEAGRGCNAAKIGSSWASWRTSLQKILSEQRAHNSDAHRQQFRNFHYQGAQGPREICNRLYHICHRWLKPEQHTKKEILDLVILKQFMSVLPQELETWVKECGAETSSQAMALVEGYLLSQAEEKHQAGQQGEDLVAEMDTDCSEAEMAASDTKERPLGDRMMLERPQPSALHSGGEAASVAQDQVRRWAAAEGQPPDKMTAKRKSYSVEYKIGIVEDSYGKNLTAFCKEKMLDIRMVQKWRAEYDNLSLQVLIGNAKKRKCGAGRQPLLPELEDMISEWIADRRAKALVVRRADIQAFALAMAPQFKTSPEFRASPHWLDGFLQRYELSLRKSTTLFKLEDAEVVKRALAFKFIVDGIDFSEYQLCNMIAMDETAVFMGQGAQTTIDQRGASSIYVPSTGHESNRVTCILAIRLDGKKATPVIITKGKKDKIEHVSGIYVLESEKAWCTQAVIKRWLDLMLPLVMRGGQRGLLVWDSASTHRAKDMRKFLAERRIDQIMIPAGMTAYLQTFDIAIKKPFKDNLHMEINDYIENGMTRNQGGNFVKPNLQEVVNWVKNSWDKITDSVVANALRAGYLDKSCSFTESSIARHERLGPMVLKEMESQEIKSGILGLESYFDVPEEDDLIIIE